MKKKRKNRKVEKKSNFEKKTKKRGKVSKKKKRKKHYGLLLIHSAFGFGETVISPHPLVICIITNYKGFFLSVFEKKFKKIIFKLINFGVFISF
jgi:hypothetical protein